MEQLILNAIVLALSVTFVVEYSQLYGWLLSRVRVLNHKPLNCALCMSFWIAVTIAVLVGTSWIWVTLPPLTAMIQIIFSRLIGLLPITFN